MSHQVKARQEPYQAPTGQKWEGRWDHLKGRAKQTWGQLTDDDLNVAEGNYEEMIGRTKERTNESPAEVERRLNT